MPEKFKQVKSPSGLARLAFRAPILLYRLGLGRLLGHRFLLLTHTGRISGLSRQAVLEVVRYNSKIGAYYIAVGFGKQTDWYKNILANPKITVLSAGRQFQATAELLSLEKAGDELVRYSHDHATAFRELVRFLGFRLDGTDADTHALAQQIPMFVLKPAN